MNKLKLVFKTHFISIIGGAIVLLILVIGYLGCRTDGIEQTVTNQQTEANKAVQQAANHNSAAVNASIERRSEDAVREKVITPKLEQTRRQSQTSKAALDAARKNHNEQKSNTSNLSRTGDDNCVDLGSLFPNIKFEECQ